MNTNDLAMITPGWLILSMLVLAVGLCVFFYLITRPYEKQMEKKFPGLNKKINVVLGLLLFLGIFVQTWENALLGIKGRPGIGLLWLFLTKYLITRYIAKTKNADLYVFKTVLIYIVIQVLIYVFVGLLV